MVQHSSIDHTGITGAGGSVATDAIFDAKGDLAAGTGANTSAKLTVGANDTILMADSGQSTGLKWVAAGTPTDQDYDDVAAAGTADTFARGDHLHGMPSAGGGGVTGAETFITGDVSIASANTFVDGPSAGSLAAGTYLIIAVALVKNATAPAFITGKLWDGASAVYNVVEQYQETAGGTRELVAITYVVLGGATTIKFSCATNTVAGGAGTIMATAATNGTTNKATKIVAIKIA